MEMELTLVVPTLGRVSELKRLLASIGKQELVLLDPRKIELIVVDQSEGENVAKLLASFKQIWRGNVNHIRIPARGASNAKNMGMRRARGKVVGFPDDDCWYPVGLLEKIYAFFSKAEKTDILFCAGFDPEKKQSLLPYPSSPLKIAGENLEGAFLGLLACQFYPSYLVKKVGQFDERLGAGVPFGSGEETDFAIRALKRGAAIHFDPELQVFQSVSQSGVESSARKAVGFGGLCKKHRLSGYWISSVIKAFFSGKISIARGRFQGWMRWNFATIEIKPSLIKE